MNKRKVLALVAGLVLSVSVAVPGTLAVEADSAGTEGSSITVTSEDGAETGSDASTTAVADFAAAAAAAVQMEPTGEESTSGSDTDAADTTSGAEGQTDEGGTAAGSQTDSSEAIGTGENAAVDSADPTKASHTGEVSEENGAAAGTETSETKKCTCGAADGASHKEDCPLYAAPETFTHKDGCSDDCEKESCTCGCHLYRRIMACRTIDEIWELIDNADEASFTLLTEEQNAKIDERIKDLEPQPAPAIVLDETTETVPSVIEYGLVSFTDVAPLGAPVIGGND